MSTYTSIVYHIIWTPYKRKPIISKDKRRELFNYIYGILKNHNCHVYRINGVEDHLHIATSLHPSVSLAYLVKDIKLASGQMIKSKKLFEGFGHKFGGIMPAELIGIAIGKDVKVLSGMQGKGNGMVYYFPVEQALSTNRKLISLIFNQIVGIDTN